MSPTLGVPRAWVPLSPVSPATPALVSDRREGGWGSPGSSARPTALQGSSPCPVQAAPGDVPGDAPGGIHVETQERLLHWGALLGQCLPSAIW